MECGERGREGTYATVYAEHVAAGKVDLAGVAGTCQVCQRVIRCARCHVRWDACCGPAWGGGSTCTCVCGVLCCIASGALDHVYGVSVLDLVCGEVLFVLEDAAGVDKALAVGRDVLVLFGRELGLEVEDGGGFGDGDAVEAVAGGLDLEGEEDLVGRLVLFRHGWRFLGAAICRRVGVGEILNCW